MPKTDAGDKQQTVSDKKTGSTLCYTKYAYVHAWSYGSYIRENPYDTMIV